MYDFYHILPQEVDDHREAIMPFLDRLAPGYQERFSAEDILENAKNQYMFLDLLVDLESAPMVLFIIEIVTYPKTKSLRVMGAVGDIGRERMPEVLQFCEAYFTDMAAENGCGFLEFEGRTGWGREFRKLGSKIECHEVVIKRIEVCHEDSHSDRIPDDCGPDRVQVA